MKLQQISSGFVYDLENARIESLMPVHDNPKVQYLKELLDNSTSKVVAYVVYRHSVDLLRGGLSDYRPAFITGGMETEDVAREVAKFNTDDECRLIIANVAVGKYGHKLTGSDKHPCFMNVFVENSYSLDSRAQCEARSVDAKRKGGLTIYDFVASDLDRQVIAALQRKEGVAQRVIAWGKER